MISNGGRVARALRGERLPPPPGKGRSYEVLSYDEGLFNGLNGYVSLGVYQASSRVAAANKALREVVEEPFDSEGAAILTPDPSIVVLSLRQLVPIEGLKIPQPIIDAFLDGMP